MKKSLSTLLMVATSLSGVATSLALTGCNSDTVYSVSFYNDDETLLATYGFNEGAMAKYIGETPTKQETAYYRYEFAGWAPELKPVTENASYIATYNEIEKSLPTAHDVKSALKFINENKNFTLSYLGGGTGAAFDLIYNENSIGYNYPTDSTNNKFIYYDGTGTFETKYAAEFGKYLPSEYRTEKDVYASGIYSSFYNKIGFLDEIQDGATSYKITDKTFKMRFAEIVGLGSNNFLNISLLETSVKDEQLNIKMVFKNKTYNFVVKDFGVSINETLELQLARGLKVFTLSDDLAKFKAGIKGNNFAQESYTFDSEDETASGFYGYCIFTDKYYLTTYYKTESYSGYVYLNCPETEKHQAYYGTYMVNCSLTLDESGQPFVDFNISALPINSTDSDFAEACFYPSTSLFIDNLQYFGKWNENWFQKLSTGAYQYVPKGIAYSTNNKAILADAVNIFGLGNMVDQGAQLATMGLDIQLDENGNLDVATIVCGLRFMGKIYNFIIPYYAFGQAKNDMMELILANF